MSMARQVVVPLAVGRPPPPPVVTTVAMLLGTGPPPFPGTSCLLWTTRG